MAMGTSSVVHTTKGPVIVIMGSTGVGKSKLAVELAIKLGKGEVVNMDSMQVYEGLDIATNKPTAEEMKRVPHHLFGFVPCHEKSFTVTKFVELAQGVIDEIHARKGIPILVGGTNYYVYSLLWTDTLMEGGLPAVEGGASQQETSNSPATHDTSATGDSGSVEEVDVAEDESGDCSDAAKVRERVLERLEAMTGVRWNGEHIQQFRDDVLLAFKGDSGENDLPSKAWRLLQSVDGLSANKLHAKDYRKVLGRLFFAIEHGRAHSAAVLEKEATCRLEHVCLLWLDGSMEELTQRINERVDAMLERGLLQELVHTCQTLIDLKHSHSAAASPLAVLDFRAGLLQAIGGKEFAEYLATAFARPDPGCVSFRGYREGDERLPEVAEGATRLKRRTRRYAVSQRKWVLNKIVARHAVHAIPVSGSNMHTVENWREMTFAAGWAVCDNFLQGKGNSSSLLVQWEACQKDSGTELKQWKKHKCEVCSRTLNGQLEWESHLRSRRHKATVKKRNRLAREAARTKGAAPIG